jgi:hypothetical protein
VREHTGRLLAGRHGRCRWHRARGATAQCSDVARKLRETRFAGRSSSVPLGRLSILDRLHGLR